MTKTAREMLHNFALTYRVESKESRNQCLDQALKELEAIIRNEKQKLLDALEAKAQEYVVIGEQLRGFPYFITVDNIKAERNKLEAEL